MAVKFILAISLIAAVPSCSEQDAKSSKPPAPRASLSVTWLVPGQPPETTTTPMTDMASCEKGRTKAILAGDEARAERERMNERDKSEVAAKLRETPKGRVIAALSPDDERKIRGVPLPQVSAFCVEQ